MKPIFFLILFASLTTGQEPRTSKPIAVQDGSESAAPIKLTTKELMSRITHCVTTVLPGQVDAKGQVAFEVLIDRLGHVETTKALTGHPITRSSAKKAVERWQFKPMTVNGISRPMSGILVVRISWDHEEAKAQCREALANAN